MTIGLIGLPANDSVNVNINGKPQKMTTGDVVHVALDASTNCQVGVQSFDMFKALLTASCASAKPQIARYPRFSLLCPCLRLLPDQHVWQRAVDLTQRSIADTCQTTEQAEIELLFSGIPSVIAG